jgi:serine/threonine protein kinase
MQLPHRLLSSQNLHFPKEDLAEFPWLNNPLRYYCITDQLGDPGAFSTPYIGYPGTDPHTREPNAHDLVIKYAKLDNNDWPEREAKQRLAYSIQKYFEEFCIIRRQLLGCVYANPIIDFTIEPQGVYQVPVSIQPFLNHHQDLDAWMLTQQIRQAAPRRVSRIVIPDWRGVRPRARWLEIAIDIAVAINDIHFRRVTHGDLHPGNIFLPKNPNGHVMLIDFGEAFLFNSINNTRHRNSNPYLAPERLELRFPLNERVDVYSFGVLLLYLATGVEHDFNLSGRRTNYAEHHDEIYKIIMERNEPLIEEEPRIIDVITQCVDKDPADRPRIYDVLDDLRQIQTTLPSANSLSSDVLDVGKTFSLSGRNIALQDEHPIIQSLCSREIHSLDEQLQGSTTDMLELHGTRSSLIRTLSIFYNTLDRGDSWTTATHLPVWQRHGLGLLGSYLSANIRAIRRHVSVRRVLAISVEELGRAFSDNLANKLEEQGDPKLHPVVQGLRNAIHHFDDSPAAKLPLAAHSPSQFSWHAERLHAFLHAYAKSIVDWKLEDCLTDEPKIKLMSQERSFLGIAIVGTIDKIIEIREDNPASVVHFTHAVKPKHRWLLVETQMRDRLNSRAGRFDPPHLLGIRIFKSRQYGPDGNPEEEGYPHNRIVNLQRLFNNDAINIGLHLESFAKVCARSIADVFTSNHH